MIQHSYIYTWLLEKLYGPLSTKWCLCFLICCLGFSWISKWCNGKESAYQRRGWKGRGLDPWDGKIPWRMKWQPTPVFWPGKFHEQGDLSVYCTWDCKDSDTTEHIHKTQVCHSFPSMEQMSFNFMAADITHSDFGVQENKICHWFPFFSCFCHKRWVWMPWS